jgi:hypothetical protein
MSQPPSRLDLLKESLAEFYEEQHDIALSKGDEDQANHYWYDARRIREFLYQKRQKERGHTL